MGVMDNLRNSFADGLRKANPNATPTDLEDAVQLLDEQIRAETPPTIAMIGETGVGKSTTLNNLFNAGLDVSHTRACTRSGVELRIELDTSRMGLSRELIVFDMPGLGESIAADEQNLAIYEEVLPKCDVVVWVLDAPNRAIRSVQEHLRDDIWPRFPDLPKRLVVALNRVDNQAPKEWNEAFNVPSREQLSNIKDREADATAHIREVLPTWGGRSVAYSATNRYRLADLFEAMVNAVPEERQWLLGDRASLASYVELVDTNAFRAVQQMRTEGTADGH